MSLDSPGGNTDKIDHGSDASLDTMSAGTVLIWCEIDVLGGFEALYSKIIVGTGLVVALMHRGDIGSGQLEMTVAMTGATHSAISASSTITTGFNFLGGVWQPGGDNAKVYRGSPTSLVTDATNTSAAGSGTQQSDSLGSACVWNWPESGFDTNSPNGRASRCMIFNTILTLGEIQAQQRRPQNRSDCVLFVEYGYNAAGTQPDWSGNGNAGTVTGMTAGGNHYPGGLMARGEFSVPYEVAAGGTTIPIFHHHYNQMRA